MRIHEILKIQVNKLSISKSELCKFLGLKTSCLNSVLNGEKKISVDLAVKLEYFSSIYPRSPFFTAKRYLYKQSDEEIFDHRNNINIW